VDRLRYRFPNELPVSAKGSFKAVELGEVTSGFILANSLGDEVYLFEPNESLTSHAKSNIELPPCLDKETYLDHGKRFLQAIIDKGLSKAVLSRVKAVDISIGIDELFDRLEKAYPAAFVYMVESNHIGIWVGASPEQLLTCEGEQCTTISLAGTLPVTSGTWSDKEKREQADVTAFIETLMRSFDISYQVSVAKEVQAGPVRHLMSAFTFQLPAEKRNLFIQQVHPTPAVVGMPKAEALQLIRQTESHQRLLYSGYIGIVSNEKTALYVNLRCAQLIDSTLYCYVGGGYNSQSIPVQEWEETENKADTLIKTLQNK
jgi:isochorismate synthase